MSTAQRPLAPASPALPLPAPLVLPSSVLAGVQKACLETVVWCIIGAGPVVALTLLLSWHWRTRGDWSEFPPDILAWAAAAITAAALRTLAYHRLQAIFLCVITTALLLSTIVRFGPMMGAGIGSVLVIIFTEFLLGRRAGRAILGVYVAALGLHLTLLITGRVSLPAELHPETPTPTLFRIYAATLIALAGARFLTVRVIAEIEKFYHERVREQVAREAATAAQHEAENRMHANQHFEALGKLASGVAHDVNNALTTIICSAEFLRTSRGSPESHQLAGDIIAASRNAAQTTRQLLSLHRRTHCRPEPVNPAPIVATVARLADRLMPRTIRLRVIEGSTRRILVDPADLQQALLNLLLNARDAMPDGGDITLHIRDEPDPASPGRLRVHLDVHDSGAGIAPEVGEQLFVPFFTTKAPGQGTGLGLTMVKQFVDDAGGTLTWTSPPGRGTTFTLTFAETTLDSTRAALSAPAFTSGPTTGGRILLVYDDDVLRALMARSLSRGDLSVVAEPSQEAALARLDRGERFNLLCTDRIVGSQATTKLIARFRDSPPGGEPVLIVSAQLTPPSNAPAEPPPSNTSFLRKPFSGNELLAEVQRLLACPHAGTR